MKTKESSALFLLLFLAGSSFAQVHTTYLWHMDQPVYWGEKSQANPNACQYVKESNDIKNAGGNKYADGVSHPLNDLFEIFSKADRVAAYQWEPKTAIGTLSDLSNAGAQVSISGCLMQNINSLGQSNQWGYGSNWFQGYKDARNWKTKGQLPKLDVIAFTNDHAFSPLVSYRTLRKEIAAHRYFVNKYYGTKPGYSKGYWPAECAFSERIIKALVDEGIEWSIIANSHLSRTLNDYPLTYGTSGCNIDPPNKADKVSTNGVNWWGGQIDGRGGKFAAPYCYTPHKAKYVDPVTGSDYKITVVPMCDLMSYKDGYSQQGTGDIDANIAPFITNPSRPPLVLLAHDGDNAWGGGSSYYEQAVTGFSHETASKGYEPTTIQQYLTDHPVPADDVVHVEDGAWVNADSDWGHPMFINWLWPMYNSSTFRFNPDGWTEDARNWAVITAVENFVTTAEDLAGSVRIEKCAEPDGKATDAEKAWHFYFTTLNSGYMYYGKALDMEVKQTVGGNHAVAYAQAEINKHAGADNTAPAIFNPQRFPYNPGEKGFGPLFGYQEKTMPTDFDVWTYVYDVSGIQSVVLKYRTDKNGVNSASNNDNETYAGGADVNDWSSVTMTRKTTPKGNVTGDPEINFFILPTAIADLCYASVTGLKDALVDYYVEATDTKGNVRKSDIQHVYVGSGAANVPVTGITVNPGSATIGLGGTQSITATVAPANATNKTVTWKSSNTAFATVNSSGVVSGMGSGTAVITATTQDGGKTATCTVTVSSTPPAGFMVYFYKPADWGSQTKVYYWSVQPAGAMPVVAWPGATMDTVGNRPGCYKYFFTNTSSTNLIFDDNAGHQTADLSRNKKGWYMNGVWYETDPYTPVSGVTINPDAGSLTTWATLQITATVNPSNATNKAFSWASSNPSVATVSASGLVTGISPGNVVITVTTQEGGKTATAAISVAPADIAYYHIRNRWQTTAYLCDASNGQLKYGSSPSSSDYTYQWTIEDMGSGYKQFKNRFTGKYMNVETLKDYVECTPVSVGWYSAQWTTESTGDGWVRIRNRWQTTNLIHIENLKGYGQRLGAQDTWWSAMWQLETVTSAKSLSASAVETAPEVDIILYPNPVHSKTLYISLKRITNKASVLLIFTDLNGRAVYQTRVFDSGQIDLNIPAGLYIVTAEGENIDIKKKLVVY
jgi:uncharacterized protein YjdB